MASNFYSSQTKELEPVGESLLKELGFPVTLNNLIDITAPDYVLDSGEFFDFQFSQKFGIYRELRIDIVSAYRNHNGRSRHSLQDAIRSNVDSCSPSDDLFSYLRTYLDIVKLGKYFENDDIKAVLYFLYNNSYEPGAYPDQILLLSGTTVKGFVETNWKSLVRNDALKLNDKSNLGDSHGSSFLCIKLDTITSSMCRRTTITSTVFNRIVDVFVDNSL
jgi:hypothetical protein